MDEPPVLPARAPMPGKYPFVDPNKAGCGNVIAIFFGFGFGLRALFDRPSGGHLFIGGLLIVCSFKFLRRSWHFSEERALWAIAAVLWGFVVIATLSNCRFAVTGWELVEGQPAGGSEK